MTDRASIRCFEPVQAHKAMTAQLWPMLKAHLMAGRRMVLTLAPETRSSEQNRRMWAMLRDISQQVDWHGNKLSEDEWKDVFTAAIKRQKVVPGLDGGFVVCGTRTSKMTKSEMGELQDLIEAFGAQNEVQFSAPEYW
jgi:hypothetical protein